MAREPQRPPPGPKPKPTPPPPPKEMWRIPREMAELHEANAKRLDKLHPAACDLVVATEKMLAVMTEREEPTLPFETELRSALSALRPLLEKPS